MAIEVDAMGATMIVACHPDEGVVVELLFPPSLCVERERVAPCCPAANDIKPRQGRKRHP